MDHIVHIASRSILEEMEALWPFLQSERTRFRSDYEGHALQQMFLMTHYTVERLRETQLRSFLEEPAVTYGFSRMGGMPYLMPRVDTSIAMDVANETQQSRTIYTECTTPPVDQISRLNLESVWVPSS
ncbi:hypothetical protein BGX30_011315 [Mortierella sp. GBA39]|nr:hypothetical protein BGX30_011315 [Mortierella sp. GBA39]